MLEIINSQLAYCNPPLLFLANDDILIFTFGKNILQSLQKLIKTFNDHGSFPGSSRTTHLIQLAVA